MVHDHNMFIKAGLYVWGACGEMSGLRMFPEKGTRHSILFAILCMPANCLPSNK